MSAVAGTAVVLVVVALLAAGACAWFMVQRARQLSREIDAQIVEIHARIAESHVENHRNIDAVNKRLDHTDAMIAESHVENHRTIDAVNKRLDHTEARIDESHRTIHAVNKRLDHTEARIDESHRTIHAVNKRLDHTEARIDESHRTIHAVNKRLDHTEARIDESHRTIHAVNKRLDHLARIEQFARIDRAASAVHQAASEGRLPAVARKKLIAHLDEVRDELSEDDALGDEVVPRPHSPLPVVGLGAGGMTATPPHRLRVGYDISKVFGVSDGIARYSELLLRGMLACGDDNQFTLCNLGGDALEHARVEQLFGADRARIVLAPDGFPRGLDVDLFHSPALAVPPAECRPLVFTLHDVTFISHAECHTLDNRVWSLATTAMAAARAARIVADSHYSKAQAIEHLGLPDELIEVIHLAPDPCFQRTEDSDLQRAVARRLGITRPYVLAVGTIEPRKNLVGLIDGMRRLPAAQRQRLSLVVAGPAGWRNDEIHNRLRDAQGELSICPVGCVSRDDLNVLYSFAEVFVYPSLSEGFGFPVLEAMACGAPVVTSDCSSLPEVAGDAAILVNPTDTAAIADAIARVVCDERTRTDLRARGLTRAREFSWERTAAQFLDLYRRVVKG